jgi:hypothetical protein
MPRSRSTWAAPVLVLALVAPARGGVVNPDISVIGQPLVRWTDAADDPARRRVTLDPGEVEFIADAALNPFARGTVVTSLGPAGLSLEEGYFDLTRGLPAGLALRGGQYRAGFGKMNPAHPHTYPFAERFHVLAAYLPGEESFNETGVSVSKQFALPRDIALTASADWLQGDSFRTAREPSASNDPLRADPSGGDRAAEPRPAGLARLAAFVPVGDRSGVEFGLSGTSGTNDVAAGTRTTVLGADLKAKLWRSADAYLLVQAEALHLTRDDAGWDSTSAAYTSTRVTPSGGYVFADWGWKRRYDMGAGYERWQRPDVTGAWDQAMRVFAGLALMEETTAFRVDLERHLPGATAGAPSPAVVNTVHLRVIYSMGPHKAHQF